MKIVIHSILPVLMLTVCGTAGSTEIIPFTGYRFGETVTERSTGNLLKMDETSSFGIMLTMDRDPTSTYDFHFSRQHTSLQPTAQPVIDLRIDYFHIGGTQYYPSQNMVPFVAGGLGITRILPEGSTYSDETDLSLSVGGGVKIPVTQAIGLRLEGRVYGTFVSGTGSILCANGGCAISLSGNLYVQMELLAGLSIAF